MPTNNPVSFRLPIHLPADVHPSVSEALRVHDDAINDLQQAIPYLKSSINTNTSSIASMAATSTASETVVAGASSNVIGEVNDQSGNNSYATQPSDYGAFILFNDTSSVAVTLSTGVTFTIPWYANFSNFGVGTVTLTPQSGTINGSGSFALGPSLATSVAYDGTNFWAEPISTGYVTQIIAGYNVTITPTSGVGAVTVNAYGGSSGPYTINDVTGSRVLGTTYQNTSGDIMDVSGWLSISGGSGDSTKTISYGPTTSFGFSIKNTTTGTIAGEAEEFWARIPANWYYKVVGTNLLTSIGAWYEGYYNT